MALCAALLVGACGGGDPAAPNPSPSLSPGAACATGDVGAKRVPPAARALVQRFVTDVDRGDLDAARQALDPAFADQVLAGLASLQRLTLLSVSDGY